jgi:transmembrane sensor
MVEAGNRVIVERSRGAPRPAVEAVSVIDLAEKLAWRVPRLQFSGTPLAEVIALFNQHSGARLVLGEPALGSLQLSGVLRADNIDSLLRLLELEFSIEADKTAGNATVLRRR